jgi:hypothetical protein
MSEVWISLILFSQIKIKNKVQNNNRFMQVLSSKYVL